MTTGPIATIVAELARFGIPHMVAGSFASTLHGEPLQVYDRLTSEVVGWTHGSVDQASSVKHLDVWPHIRRLAQASVGGKQGRPEHLRQGEIRSVVGRGVVL